jgi:hypothetical protein
MDILTITQLEALINKLRLQNPTDTRSFSNCEEINALAGLYGEMIIYRRDAIQFDQLDATQRKIVQSLL